MKEVCAYFPRGINKARQLETILKAYPELVEEIEEVEVIEEGKG